MIPQPSKRRSTRRGNPQFPTPFCSLPTARFSTKTWAAWTLSNCGERFSPTCRRTTSASISTGRPVPRKRTPGKVVVNSSESPRLRNPRPRRLDAKVFTLTAGRNFLVVRVADPEAQSGRRDPENCVAPPPRAAARKSRRPQKQIRHRRWLLAGRPRRRIRRRHFLAHLSRRLARWHLKSGVHKYVSVPANQFA